METVWLKHEASAVVGRYVRSICHFNNTSAIASTFEYKNVSISQTNMLVSYELFDGLIGPVVREFDF